MIKEELCDGSCVKGECVCPQTFQSLIYLSRCVTVNSTEIKPSIPKEYINLHAVRICNNYIRKALNKSYQGETVTETTLTKEDIK